MTKGTDGWNLSIRTTLLPKDTNQHGTIFGGVILSYIDIACAVEAKRFCEQEVVTVAMKEVEFKEPVFVGDLISFYTRIIHTGRSAITVEVRVMTLHDQNKPMGREDCQVTDAQVTFVAINSERRPEPIRIRDSRHDPPAFSPEYLKARLKVD
ncbi:MAG: acyl-CoA thioesterase [Acidobacteriota bacterium]|nr:acyl-CoA thioesterase [Acidobacteriota bacterium]